MQDRPAGSAPTIDEIRSSVNSLLREWFEAQYISAEQIGKPYAELWQTILELSQSGGKRIRPYLTALSYQAFGGRDLKAILPVAAAQELLHLGLLVHDDIIDRDDTRYGRMNISGTYKQRLKSLTDNADHYAQSTALLAGDMLISGSYQLTLKSNLPPESLIHISQLLSEAIFDVGGGEFLDTLASFSPIQTFDSLHIADFKTASYSFITPLLIGATAAGASADAKLLLKKLGRSLGIAYQLSDDLLGTFGDAAHTGKPTDGDIREKKRTYLLQQTFALANASQQEELTALFNKPELSHGEVDHIRQLMVATGAKAQVEAAMHRCATEGKQQLKLLALEAHYVDILESLIDKAVWRNH